MTHVGALDIDIDAVRTKYTEAIDAYRGAARELDAGSVSYTHLTLPTKA